MSEERFVLSLQSSDGENSVCAPEDEVSSSPGASSNPRAGFHPHFPSDSGETVQRRRLYSKPPALLAAHMDLAKSV